MTEAQPHMVSLSYTQDYENCWKWGLTDPWPLPRMWILRCKPNRTPARAPGSQELPFNKWALPASVLTPTTLEPKACLPPESISFTLSPTHG